MSKIKLAIVALSVIAAGGFMTACNDGPRGTHTPIDANAANPSAGDTNPGETEQQKLERLMKERQDRMNSIAAKLNYIGKKSYDSDKCSAADKSSLMEKINSETQETINNQTVTRKGSLKRVMTVGLSVKGLKMAINALVSDLSANNNDYCSINVASDVAQKGKGYLANFGREGISTEDNNELIDQAEVIADGLSPLVADLMNKIHSLEAAQEFQANVKKLEEVSNEASSKIAALEAGIDEVRSNFTCNPSNIDTDDCHPREGAQRSVVSRMESLVEKAKQTVDQFGSSSISGPGDSSLGSKIEVIEKINAELQAEIDLATRIAAYQKSEASKKAAADYSENSADYTSWATPLSPETVEALRLQFRINQAQEYSDSIDGSGAPTPR